MKLKLWFLAATFIILSIPGVVRAESISSFTSTLTVLRNSSLDVQEQISYDFGTVPHHGIFRDIPFRYQARGGNYNLGIAVKSVTDQQGHAYQYTTARSGDAVEIKIGNPNNTITGPHVYILHYTVDGAINYFQDHDELYWNVTGNDWPVTMQSVAANVSLAGMSGASLQVNCFAGIVGSTSPCGQSGVTNSQAMFTQSSLNPGQGLTIVVGFPKGTVVPPTRWQKILKTVSDNWILVLPFISFGGMWLLWKRRGRDAGGFTTIVPQYEAPKNMTPLEVGVIIDESADSSDVSAEIIYLATQGYITINKLNEKFLVFKYSDYRLDKLKDESGITSEFDQTLMSGLFKGRLSVKFSDLKNSFYKDLETVKKQAYDSVTQKQYFYKNPSSVRSLYAVIGMVIFFAGFALGRFGFYTIAAVSLSGLIIALFGKFMPAKTVSGAEAKQYILGFKMYLSVAEKDRLKFFNAPDKTPERFEAFLPYAMVLGVEKEWAKQFEGIYNKSPSWYNDPSGSAFNSFWLISSLHDFNTATNTALSSRPSSAAGGGSGFGGGGFSGGGFGGGGGGSW